MSDRPPIPAWARIGAYPVPGYPDFSNLLHRFLGGPLDGIWISFQAPVGSIMSGLMVLDGDGYQRGIYQPLDQRHNGAPIEFQWEPARSEGTE